MKKLLVYLFILPIFCMAQNSMTFEIEKLQRPGNPFPTKDINTIYRQFVLAENKLDHRDMEVFGFDIEMIAHSDTPAELVNTHHTNPFFYGMYQAYADHRPFVLSPDMIWLLISQGFAQHVKNNAEQLRNVFVDFEGKIDLVVTSDEIPVELNSPAADWEKLFPRFSEKISGYVGQELTDMLTADFSTSTPVSKAASQITLMKAFEPYFDYVYIMIVCGIPEITLEGTTEDWEKVLAKAQYLRKYDCGWWIDEIEPILKKIIQTKKGKIDKKFWMNMFKYHTLKQYGSPRIIDGWIVKFYPYSASGERHNLKELTFRSKLPSEMVNVNLRYILAGDGKEETIPLELWAGFAGLSQDETTFALRPEISWMIHKKSGAEFDLAVDKLQAKDSKDDWGMGIYLTVSAVPDELLKLEKINILRLHFTKEIYIPDAMAKIEIKKLYLKGKIDEDEIERLKKLFPETFLVINGKGFNKAENETINFW